MMNIERRMREIIVRCGGKRKLARSIRPGQHCRLRWVNVRKLTPETLRRRLLRIRLQQLDQHAMRSLGV